jgi:VWFA-related protein
MGLEFRYLARLRFKSAVIIFFFFSLLFIAVNVFARQFEPGEFVSPSSVGDRTGDLRTEIIYRGSGNDEIRFIYKETNSIIYSVFFDNSQWRPLDTFSPDGKTLYLLWQAQHSSPGQISKRIELIDIYNSRLIRTYDVKYGAYCIVTFSRCSNVAFVRIDESFSGQWDVDYFLLDLKDSNYREIGSGGGIWKYTPSAYITPNASNVRVQNQDGTIDRFYSLGGGSIPNDPDPPMPSISIIPEAIVDGSSAAKSFKTISSLAKRILSKITEPANFPSIKYAVRVINADKRPITGLTLENFQVKEDGVLQSPITLKAQSSEPAVSVVLCLDTSGSINDTELSSINSAANKFVDLFAANDRGAIYKFSTNVSLIAAFTQDKSSLKNAINASPPERGLTSLHDSIYEAIDLCRKESNRKAVVILTDGYDNDSGHSLQQIIDYSLENRVPVFTIGLGNPLNASLLQKIADDCRGIYFHALNTDKLEEVFNRIVDDIRNRYIITYTTTNPAKDGTVRTVETIVSSGGGSASATLQYRAPQGKKPVAQIVSITPNPASLGENVTFQGIGTDIDGTITEYNWRSSIDGVIGTQETFQISSLSPGEHTIYFKVKDNDNLWSDEVSTALPVLTKVTISGNIRYENRIFNETATGDVNATEYKPVRFADFEIIRASDNTTALGSGQSDENGNYTCEANVRSGEQIFLRCFSRQDNSDYKIAVKDTNGNDHFKDSEQISASQDNLTINLDITEASAKGGAFNIFDCLVKGASKVKELSGLTPPLIAVKWEKGTAPGTYYDGVAIIYLNGSVSDPDEYDDAVILHEYGHFIAKKYSYDRSPGGGHQRIDTNQDIRLSWSEGWAACFSGIVRNSPAYIDKTKNSILFYSIETLDDTEKGSLVSYAQGQDTEIAVSSILWDIFDNPSGDDDTLSLGVQPIWYIFVGFRPYYDCVLEDFYVNFFSNPANEIYRSQINNIFASRRAFYSDSSFKRGKLFSKSDGRTIPDGDGNDLISELEVPDNLFIKDINVFLYLPHNYRSDLKISLISPSNREVILHNHTSSLSGQPQDIFVWYQEPYETIPAESLDSNFRNQPTQGIWKLKVNDPTNHDGIDDAGSLQCWQIEIKGSPATVELTFRPGWNFFSLPFKVTDSKISAVLSPIQGKYIQVSRYNSQEKKFEHYVGNSRYNQFDSFEYSRGYEIYISGTNSVILSLTGQLPQAKTIALKSGWNLIGSPKLEELPVEEALKTLQLGIDYSRVCRYNPLTKTFENYTQSKKEFTTFKPAEAYYLYCLKDINWTVEP